MPGHKGDTDTALAGQDITEIEGADVLYSPSGIILESERNAEALFKKRMECAIMLEVARLAEEE